jgi:hypothetical protein
VRNEDVFRLEIAMDDALLVRRRQTAGDNECRIVAEAAMKCENQA